MKYTKQLEQMVIFLAQSYEECKKIYKDDIHKKAFVDGKHVGLSEQDQKTVLKFPLIQGFNMTKLVDSLSKKELSMKALDTKSFYEMFERDELLDIDVLPKIGSKFTNADDSVITVEQYLKGSRGSVYLEIHWDDDETFIQLEDFLEEWQPLVNPPSF